jgi:hypothetical protein
MIEKYAAKISNPLTLNDPTPTIFAPLAMAPSLGHLAHPGKQKQAGPHCGRPAKKLLLQLTPDIRMPS